MIGEVPSKAMNVSSSIIEISQGLTNHGATQNAKFISIHWHSTYRGGKGRNMRSVRNMSSVPSARLKISTRLLCERLIVDFQPILLFHFSNLYLFSLFTTKCSLFLEQVQNYVIRVKRIFEAILGIVIIPTHSFHSNQSSLAVLKTDLTLDPRYFNENVRCSC